MTVEFFLVLPVAILVMVASLQVVGLARARLELQAAVREGARVAATTPDPSRAVDAVLASLDPAQRPRTRVSVQRPGVVGLPAVVTASLRQPLGPPFPEEMGVEITARATMRTER